MCVWRLVLLLHCGSETKAVTAAIYLHIISMLCSDTDTDETHALILYKKDTVSEWLSHKSRACHFVFCRDIKELTHSDLCIGGTLGSCRVTAMSRRCLESQLCSLTHSLQTLHHTFTCRSHQPIHAEERKRVGGLYRQGSPTPSPSLSCSPPLLL